jgi:16S rRNA (guanine(527)-N(7))-methyltransferase RsmG
MRREGFPQAASTARCGVTNPLWHDLAKKAGVTLGETQVAQLSRYLDLLLAANARMNLTRITDPAQAAVQHVGDALTLLPFLPRGEFRLADVGTGGGVPGIPLAIARPDARLLLIESTKKKATFLRETIAALGLTNVEVSDARAEDAGRAPNTREKFDVVTARAVGTLDWLAEWCLPLTKIGGRVLAMKGPRVVEELPQAMRALKLLGGAAPIVHNVELPEASGHVIVEIVKVGRTDPKYPRLATVAKGKPL